VGELFEGLGDDAPLLIVEEVPVTIAGWCFQN
jgi:hypothetical protein